MSDITISAAQDGERMSVRVGDRINLTLPENASSGYRWSIRSHDDTVLSVEDSGYRADASVGGAGVAEWTFRAKEAGATLVELVRWRRWEGERSIVERFSFSAEIAPG